MTRFRESIRHYLLMRRHQFLLHIHYLTIRKPFEKICVSRGILKKKPEEYKNTKSGVETAENMKPGVQTLKVC